MRSSWKTPGVAAIVMYSLFEEQIIHESLELDHYLTRGTDSFAEALTYFPDAGTYSVGPGRIPRAPAQDQEGGQHPGHRQPERRLHRRLDRLCPADPGSRRGCAGAEPLLPRHRSRPDQRTSWKTPTSTWCADVAGAVSIPLAVKLSPFFTALPNFARRLVEAGADGLVLFNRFYQPDFDLEELEVVPNLVLSTSTELRLPLRWIAILYGRVQADLALTSGVHTAEDVLKAMMAGAKVAMIASELLQNGIGRIPAILDRRGRPGWRSTNTNRSSRCRAA